MNTTKTLLTAILVMASATTVLGAKKKPVVQQPLDPNEKVAYLFTYFNSNDPKDEQICYALSEDGYNYTPINDGMPVIESDTEEYRPGELAALGHQFPHTLHQDMEERYPCVGTRDHLRP